MSHNRPFRPSSGPELDMYDDQAYPNDRHYRSSQGHEIPRQDNTRTTPRAPSDDRMHPSTHSERGYREDRIQSGREGRFNRSRSPRREGRRRYTDWDREDYQSPRERSRSRSPFFGGPPSRNVILEGLPTSMTQEDIFNELQHNLRLEGLEEVRLIKDKRTGQSRQFAFAQFASVPDAKRFLERHYPTVSLYGLSDSNQVAIADPANVRIAYSRDREDKDKVGKGEDDWKCEVCHLPNFPHRMLCFRCNAPRTRATVDGVVTAQNNKSASGCATTGDSDASPDGTASQFLLLRGLEPGVTEELLAKGVSKLYKTKSATPTAETQSTRKSKISSTANDASLGAKDGTLRRVLLVRDRKSNESWRYGFAEFQTVEDAQAAVAKFKASDKFTISSKPVLVSHIHAGVFVPVLHNASAEHANFTFSPLSNPDVKLSYWDEAAYVSELVTAVVEEPSKSLTKQNENARLAAAAANEGLVGLEPRPKKRKVEKDPKVIAPHLQFWTNRHAEIYGIPPKETEESTSELDHGPQKNTEEVSANATPSQTFADMDRKCCLLCSRQFKTEAEVNKHERMSQLHRDNMKNNELVAKTILKLNKSRDANQESSAYRDRAKERRQAFNQPKQPAAQHNKPTKDSTPTTVAKEKESPAPATSKGAALLGKMGWTAGEGLGAQGTGRTDAITTELYTQGVGLGAEGGKIGDAAAEASRQTKGDYVDFLNKTKEKAKQRFESLG